MSLLFLTSQDFNISKGERGSLLCNKIPGFSLILFYSTQCAYCHKVIPIFKQLPQFIRGCQFAILNVSKNNQLVRMSKSTIAPLEYVPYIILYTEGNPFMRYEGAHDITSIRNFILEVQKSLQHKEQFSKKEEVKLENKIPSYTIGKPLCGDDKRCYLDFGDAYAKAN